MTEIAIALHAVTKLWTVFSESRTLYDVCDLIHTGMVMSVCSRQS